MTELAQVSVSSQLDKETAEERRQQVLERRDMLQKYSDKMYCKKEIFNYSVDLTGSKATWMTLGDEIFSMDQDKKKRFLEIIRCSAYLSKDRQIENFLAQNNIYRDKRKNQKEMREQSK